MSTSFADPSDPRLADYRRLNDGAFRRSVEAPKPFAPGIFVAEGWLVLERALAARSSIRSILVAETRTGRLTELLDVHRGPTPEVFVADAATIEAIVGFDLHRGVVAIGERRRLPDLDTLVRRSERLLVIEGVSDTENLGALFRNAAALNADGVVVDTTSADPWSRRVIRTSVGHALTMAWCRSPMEAVLGALSAHRRIGLTPSGDLRLTELDRPGVQQAVALLVGAEGPGLTGETLDGCPERVRIDMAGGVDSVNVATAAAIAMWRMFS